MIGQPCWTPAPLFAGRTVFILGGGPSLRLFHVEQLRGRAVVAVNSAVLACPWADVLCFQDHPWFEAHAAAVDSFEGLICTTAQRSKAARPERIHRLYQEIRADFPIGRPTIKHGRSSGHVAVSLAIAMAAARVVLIGFDCRVVTDEAGQARSHFHDEAPPKPEALYSDDFRPAWRGWAAAATRAGVEVLNCTPGSALEEFPRAELAAVLADGRP